MNNKAITLSQLSPMQWTLLGVAALIFFVGLGLIGRRTARRTNCSLLLLMCGFERDTRFTTMERVGILVIMILSVSLASYALVYY